MIHIFPDLKRHTPCRNLIEKRKVKKKKIHIHPERERERFPDTQRNEIVSHTRRQWLTPVILATQEAEIRRIAV
jgi:hypothetical protein